MDFGRFSAVLQTARDLLSYGIIFLFSSLLDVRNKCFACDET